MIRRFFEWLEHWAMEDDNAFIGMGKMFLIVGIFVGLLLSPFIIADAMQSSFELKSADWYCTESHEETHLVMSGKVLVPITEPVCDNWRRRGTR